MISTMAAEEAVSLESLLSKSELLLFLCGVEMIQTRGTIIYSLTIYIVMNRVSNLQEV